MAKYKKFSELNTMTEQEQLELIEKALDEKKHKAFQKKINSKLEKFIKKHPKSKYINHLACAPDLFQLLCKLLTDNRVPLNNKIYIAAIINYLSSPFELLVDIIQGSNIKSEATIAINSIKSLIDSVDEKILTEHWDGKVNVIDQLNKLIAFAESILKKDITKKIKKLLSK